MQRKKIGVIGANSKRYKSFYREIIKKSNFDVLLWNRSKIEYDLNENEKIVSLNHIVESSSIDIVLCFLPSDKNFDFLSNQSFNSTVLIETPVTDTRWLNFNSFPVGVLEQWPYYPLELFKRLVYKSGLISKPYQLLNDCRSFDYHAIAQLRSVNNKPRPVKCMGLIQNKKQEGFVDISKEINLSSDDWTYGMSLMDDSSVILYSFAYNCKKSILKPFQMIRHVSIDGSITSGRNLNMQDDYEMASVTYLTKDKQPRFEKILKNKDASGNLLNISIENLSWENKFKNFEKDAELAVLYLLEDAINNNNLYSPLDSYIDILMTSSMKQSSLKNTIINFN